MMTDSVTTEVTDSKEVTESTSLPADVTDDSCRLEFIEITYQRY